MFLRAARCARKRACDSVGPVQNDGDVVRAMFARAALILPLALFFGVMVSSTAHAKSKSRPKPKHKTAAVCARAAERAQQHRIDGKLLAAQEELHTCMKSSCPAVIRSHCTRWFEEVESALPSIVLRVTDEAGHDLTDVTVSVDGAVIDSWREGLPIVLDPGEHEFVYERPGYEPVLERVLIAASEKNRVLSITLATKASTPRQTSAYDDDPRRELSDLSEHDDPARAPRRRPSAAAWIAGSAALAAWGSFAYFGITGQKDMQHLRDTCAGECPQSEVDKAWTRLVIADVSLGVAVVATGVATWLFVASTRKDHKPARTSVGMAPTGAGGFVHMSTRF